MNEQDKIRVLQVTSGFRKGVSGGIPSVLYNYCTAPAFESDIEFDYLALGYQTYEPYRKELEEKGGNLYNLDIHSTGSKRLIDIFIYLRRFLKGHNYDIVHINSGALTQVLVSALAAKSVKAGRIIVHSHNAMKKPKSREYIYTFIKPLFYLCADKYFACSEMAATSMFPKGIIKKEKWELIANAIQVDRFRYDETIRNEYRKEYNIQDKFVIGHVGRFNEQKNHAFLMRVFEKVASQVDNAVLLLVGTGELQDKIRSEVAKAGLEDRVIFTGQRRDANCFMQAMDLFVFPSIYEGLGMVLIEAQVSGLHVLSADTVPYEETKITDEIDYLPLSEEDKWVEYIVEHRFAYEREDQFDKVVTAGYELNSAAEMLKGLYKKMI